jgi:hypothetical protein
LPVWSWRARVGPFGCQTTQDLVQDSPHIRVYDNMERDTRTGRCTYGRTSPSSVKERSPLAWVAVEPRVLIPVRVPVPVPSTVTGMWNHNQNPLAIFESRKTRRGSLVTTDSTDHSRLKFEIHAARINNEQARKAKGIYLVPYRQCGTGMDARYAEREEKRRKANWECTVGYW